MIDDFVLKEPIFSLCGRNLDFEKLVDASESDFAQVYSELMQEYRNKNGWWSDGKTPKCNECSDLISSPKQLRRYHGLSMHPYCFKQFYSREGDDNEIMRKYWQRVANLVLDS